MKSVLTRRKTPRWFVFWLVICIISAQLPFFAATAFAESNLALGKTVTASGYVQTYVPTNTVDGNSDTYWESTNNAFPQWIQVDLGNASTLSQIVLKLPNSPSWETRSQTLSVQGSADGANYSTLAASASYTFNPSSANTVSINMSASNIRYVKLTFTANSGWPAAQLSELEIYGSSGGGTSPIPGKIEAENYSAMSGIQTETTSDTGGGLNVGRIDNGDWMDYSVNVQNAGTYTFEARVASPNASQQLQLRTSGGAVLAALNVPNTGDWQNWTTVSANVTLSAGAQTLRLYAASTGFNVNWINFNSSTADTQSPTAPTNLAYTEPVSGQIKLTWNASTDNVGVTGYDIYLNNALLTSIAGNVLTYTDNRSTTATVSYYVKAKDAAGNVSAASNTVTRNGPTGTGSNLALNKLITASSNTQTYVAANANDGSTSTYWEGADGSYPNTLTVDLGSHASITSVVVKLNPDPAWQTRTQTIQVLGRDQNSSTFANLVNEATYTFNPSTGNQVTIPVTATASAVQLKFTANSGATGGQAAEFEVIGTPAPNPDLIVNGLSWSPASPTETDDVTLSATVQNTGTAASAATSVNFYLGTAKVGTTSVAALAAGASATVSAKVGAQNAGTYSASAKVDEDNAVIEISDANNSFTNPTSLTVNPVAGSDLIGTTAWFPATPVTGNAVSFSVTLKNQGTTASAGGSHGITVDLKNASGTTVQSFNGTYNGTLAAGASTNVVLPGSWTAAGGTYTVTTTVAVDANESAIKQSNNTESTNLVVYSARGASMPYSRYDTDDGVLGGGAVLRTAADFDQSLTASEASGQSYAALPSKDSYIQWTVRPGQGGAGVTMRFTMPDSSDGMGLNGSLDVYVNGAKVKTQALTSYYSWQYFSGDQPADAPGGGRPLFRFDEVHFKLAQALQPGDTIRIQKGSDSIEYGVDFLEIEPVPSAIARPANSVSVTDYGAVAGDGQDDLAAFNAAVTAAIADGKTLYIPEGTFHLGNMWQIGSVSNMINNLTVTGAGIWYTNLQFTNPNASSGGISFRISGKLDFSNVYMNSNLRSRYNQNAVYKAFMDDFGTNSVIHDIWEEHFECGMWIGDYGHTPATIANGLLVENSRIRNNLADGINFAQGTSNSTVRNSSLRNNGDDALAVWTSNTNGAPEGVNNTFSFNTIENNWRAGGIAFFGGSGHSADHNYISDCVGGSGIRMNTVFPGYHFQNNTGITFSDTTIVRCGTSQDLYNGERGAIDLEASTDPIKNVTFNNIDILNTQRDGVQFGYSGGFQNIVFNNIVIDGTGLDGVTTSRFSGPHQGAAIYAYTNNGSATFNNLTVRNIAYPDKYYIQEGFNLTVTTNNSDTQAPSAPSGLAYTEPASGQIKLTWNASTDNVGVTGYDIYLNNTLLTSVAGNVLIYTDNQPTTATVSYYVKAKDAAGNVSPASNTVTRGGTGGNDTQAPSAPSGLAYTEPGSGQIKLTWNASTDNVGVTGYDIYLNNALLTSVAGNVLTYTDNQPTTATVSYYVKAKDAAGNVSPASNTVTRNGQTGTGSNLAQGKPITASSYTFTYAAANANDGDVTTYWEGGGNSYPNTLTVDLGANVSVTSVVVKLNPDPAWSTRSQTIQVLGHDQNSSTFNNLVSAASYTFNPGTGNTVTIPVAATASQVQLKFTANSGAPAGQVAELQVIGSPAPNPDLIVNGLSWSPASPTETDDVTLSATVQNTGTAASAVTSVNFYLGTTKVGTASVPALAAGVSANVSANIGAQNAGTYSASAKVDENNAVIEISDANNSITNPTSLIVEPVASSDLIVTASWTPSNPSAGNTVTFTVNLKNQGTVASASGSHAITLTLKNSAGTTIQTLNGSYNGVLAAGVSANVTMGVWTVVNGSYAVTTTVAADANEVAAKQGNNTSTASLYSGRGANMPFTVLEAESSSNTTNGTKLAPNFLPGDYAGEASGRSAVYLDAAGEYVEFTLTAPANAFVLRNAVAENTTGTISIYANGADKGNFTVSSKYSYVYATPDTLGRLGYDNSGTKAYWLYEDAQLMLDQVYPAGTKIRIQKDSGDVPWIYVDMIETENVAPAASNPDPSKYVEVSATKSIDQALTEFRQDSTKKGIFIPAGTWTITNKISVSGRATEIVGAGPWWTKLEAPQNQSNSDVGFRIDSTANGSTLRDFSAWGNYQYRVDGPGKFIDGDHMQNVTVQNIWTEHFICLYWGVGASNNTFRNNRIKNTFADGINMTNGSNYNIIDNNYARATGDDSFAEFSAVDAGGSYNVGNQFTNDTAVNVRRAAAFAAYGGSGNTFQNLYGADTLTYPGLTISSLSFGYNTLGFGDVDTVFDGITLDRTGGDFWTSVGADDKINNYQNFGAIWLFGGDRVFKNILVKNVDINYPVYFGLMFQSKYPEALPMQNIRLENININNASRYGIKLVVKAEDGQGPAVGSASFTNVKVNSPGIQAIYGEAQCPNFQVIRVSGNNW